MKVRWFRGRSGVARLVGVVAALVALTVGPQVQVSAKARPVADLAVTMVESADPVQVGDSFRYDVAVANRGSGKALDVALEDSLPPEVKFVSVSSSRGSCSGGQQVTCSLGDLGPGAEAVIAINVTAAQAGSATNTATATSRSDNTRANNSATAVTTIEAAAPNGLVNVHLRVDFFFRSIAYKACTVRVPKGSDDATVLDAAVADGCLRSWDRGERFAAADPGLVLLEALAGLVPVPLPWLLSPTLCIDDICDGIWAGYAMPVSACCYTYWSQNSWDTRDGAFEGARFEFTYHESFGCRPSWLCGW